MFFLFQKRKSGLTFLLLTAKILAIRICSTLPQSSAIRPKRGNLPKFGSPGADAYETTGRTQVKITFNFLLAPFRSRRYLRLKWGTEKLFLTSQFPEIRLCRNAILFAEKIYKDNYHLSSLSRAICSKIKEKIKQIGNPSLQVFFSWSVLLWTSPTIRIETQS